MTSEVGPSGFSYGTHLLAMLTGVENREALDSPERLCGFLASLVERVGMRVLDGPRAASEGGDEDHYGHSAVVILYESHAAVHTYPGRRSLFIDLFSCKEFAEESVLSACREFLGGFTVSERLLLDRGAHWSGSADSHLAPWVATRGSQESAQPVREPALESVRESGDPAPAGN